MALIKTEKPQEMSQDWDFALLIQKSLVTL